MNPSMLLMAILFVANPHSRALSRIEIHPIDDCASGLLSIDVQVKVEQDSFLFSPSCDFYFDKSFTTGRGLHCALHSGMCSSFWSDDTMEVTCEDGSKESIKLACPSDHG